MRYFFYLLSLFVFSVLISCADKKEQANEQGDVAIESDVVVGQDTEEGRSGHSTVFDAVIDNETLQLLRDALHTTNLDSVLEQEGPFTVFAPSDRAFEALDPRGENNLPVELDEEQLKQVLLRHVVKGSYQAADLTEGKTLTALDGSELTVMMQEGELIVDSALVVFADREADNGYVHIIDQVLMPN